MTIIVTLAAVLFAYLVGLIVYRLYLHPLANVPGPKLAACTPWFCYYHDIMRSGRYIWTIKEMHERYGPIVRVMPDAVHVNDPAFVDQLYPGQAADKRRDRAWTVSNKFLDENSVIATRDHDLHRKRRAVLSPFFSRQNVRLLVPTINKVLYHFLDRLDQVPEESIAKLNPLCRAATTDVIQAYVFGESRMNILMDDYNADFFQTLAPREFTHVSAYFPWVSRILRVMPVSMVLSLNPSARAFVDFIEEIRVKVEAIRKSDTEPEKRTIFHEILQSNIPPEEKATSRLVDEGMVLTIAGSDTTAATLLAIIYHVLSDESIFTRLRKELETAMPDPGEPPVPSELDRLPFLNALIEETLRMYPTVVSRQDRVAPSQDLVYQHEDGRTVLLPAGTIIGMTSPLLNRHPSWISDPETFNPDRYIVDPQLMRRHLTFSKGGRICLGINLAYQELQSFTAGLFRKYGRYDRNLERQNGPTLELYQTTSRDIELYSDFVTAHTYPGSEGVRVRVRHR